MLIQNRILILASRGCVDSNRRQLYSRLVQQRRNFKNETSEYFNAMFEKVLILN